MIERPDHWILPISGRTVTRCSIDHAFGVDLWESDDRYASISIEGVFTLLRADGCASLLNPAGKPTALAPALGLFALRIEQAQAFKDGTLEMAFTDGSTLRVDPDPHYEAWTFVAAGGSRVVSLPGGDLAVWSPMAV